MAQAFAGGKRILQPMCMNFVAVGSTTVLDLRSDFHL